MDIFTRSLSQLTVLDIVEHVALFILLIFCFYMYFKGSTRFNQVFFPLTCLLAFVIKTVSWAANRNEPEFMTFIVERVAPLLPGTVQALF
jgi:hypothetical protein